VDPIAEGAVRREKRRRLKRRRKTKPRCAPPRPPKRRRRRAKRSTIESPYPQARRPRAGSAGGRSGIVRGKEADSPFAVDSARRRRKRRQRACTRKRKRKRATPRVVPVAPVPPPPAAPAAPLQLSSPIAIYSGPFGVRQAERLLWRAGFGPSPGHAEFLAAAGLHGAVAALTRPEGAPVFTGAPPVYKAYELDNDPVIPIKPLDRYGHDHLWFLDRMIRTSQPLVERMTLVWHDWFATSNDGVGDQELMLAQNETFRRHAFGRFDQLVRDVTTDGAMIVWLNQDQNAKGRPNENYARELMELFTLGADRGAYTETDVRELARALTGWRSSWSSEQLYYNFRFDPNRHDGGVKTVFGRAGNWNWEDALRLCVGHPMHPSFFIDKLWRYFIATPPSASDRQALETLYVSSGYQVRPVLEAILLHPDLHEGQRMVKPPVVFLAGLYRRLQRTVDREELIWQSDDAGQRLFYPPDVAGWDDTRWLDTMTVKGRWELVRRSYEGRHISGTAITSYSVDETPEQALAAARAFWGDPDITPETLSILAAFAASSVPGNLTGTNRNRYRAWRQNALRILIYASPDLQTS
jgi:uncharacterized protein (DUF1800 family)